MAGVAGSGTGGNDGFLTERQFSFSRGPKASGFLIAGEAQLL